MHFSLILSGVLQAQVVPGALAAPQDGDAAPADGAPGWSCKRGEVLDRGETCICSPTACWAANEWDACMYYIADAGCSDDCGTGCETPAGWDGTKPAPASSEDSAIPVEEIDSHLLEGGSGPEDGDEEDPPLNEEDPPPNEEDQPPNDEDEPPNEDPPPNEDDHGDNEENQDDSSDDNDGDQPNNPPPGTNLFIRPRWECGKSDDPEKGQCLCVPGLCEDDPNPDWCETFQRQEYVTEGCGGEGTGGCSRCPTPINYDGNPDEPENIVSEQPFQVTDEDAAEDLYPIWECGKHDAYGGKCVCSPLRCLKVFGDDGCRLTDPIDPGTEGCDDDCHYCRAPANWNGMKDKKPDDVYYELEPVDKNAFGYDIFVFE